ncbi:MAG: amidoligase family protein [Thermoguttaceae bacterium]|nr:amidoligase family protein [Thermoguttaceae bacterium]
MDSKDYENMTFGVEIETLAPRELTRNNELTVGRYHCGRQVPFLPRGWKAMSDGSVSGNGISCEIVSPVLKGKKGIERVFEVVEKLRERGFTVNETCGVHVHVGAEGIAETALKTLTKIVSYLETAIFSTTGSARRDRSRWCKGVRRYMDADYAFNTIRRDRYHILNLTNVGNPTKNTVEFRAFNGSLSPLEVASWCQLALGVVARAKNAKRPPKWIPDRCKGSRAKSGVGQEDVERLIQYLGWSDSLAKLHGGVHYGWLSSSEIEKQARKSFRQKAKEFDATEN